MSNSTCSVTRDYINDVHEPTVADVPITIVGAALLVSSVVVMIFGYMLLRPLTAIRRAER